MSWNMWTLNEEMSSIVLSIYIDNNIKLSYMNIYTNIGIDIDIGIIAYMKGDNPSYPLLHILSHRLYHD